MEQVESIAVGQHPFFTFVIRNFGTTPAYRVQHQTTWSFVSFPEPRELILPKLTSYPKSPEISLAPKVESSAQLVAANALTQEQWDNATRANAKPLVWGTIHYQDAFRGWRFTDFAFYYAGRMDGKDRFIMANTGNDAN
jgi:hypothetical protein